MEDCVFCKIVLGKIPCVKLFENESVLAFLDIMPASKGHLLVIPKKHHVTLLDSSHEELNEIMKVVQKVSAAAVKATKADGFNVLQSNHAVAGQVIPHLHFHVIPRHGNDGLHFQLGREKAEEKELIEWQKLIKEKL